MTPVFYLLAGMVLSLLLLGVSMRLIGFRAQTPDDYVGLEPVFDIKQKLNGRMDCEGMIYGPLGRVSSRFVAEFNATWVGNVCTMTEHFKYDSGTHQNREWTLTLRDDNTILATAPDVVGTGEGQQNGATVVLNYNIELTAAAGGYVLAVTDWMYLMENGVILNRSQFRKFGIKVAELVATIRPIETQSTMAAE